MTTKSSAISLIVASLFAAGVQAEEPSKFDMFVSGEGAYNRYELKGDALGSGTNTSRNDNSYGLRATAAYQDPSHFGLQVDALYKKYDLGSSDASNVDLAGHAFYRNDQFLIGGIVQHRNPNLSPRNFHTGNLGTDFSADLSVDVVTQQMVSEQVFWGAEGQAYLGDVTLTGQLAKQEFVNQSDISGGHLLDDGYVGTMKAKYFIQDNWMADAGFNYNKTYLTGTAGGGSFNQKTYSLGTEYRFNQNPVSLFAQYNRNELDIPGTGMDNDQVLVGIKFNMGSTTLKGRDRSGASLDPLSQPPAGALFLGSGLNNINIVP